MIYYKIIYAHSLKLRGNPLLCACSNLDFLSWLWETSVQLDGDEGADVPYKYRCTTDSGQITDTAHIASEWDAFWRRCYGFKAFAWALSLLLIQVLM